MQKIKAELASWIASEKGKNLLTAGIIILVGLASYGAGRLSARPKIADLEVIYPDLPIQATEAPGSVQGASTSIPTASASQAVTKPVNSNIKTYFASSRGSKYYHLGCTGGKTLKEENKIYFATAEEAERAGYELSTSCK